MVDLTGFTFHVHELEGDDLGSYLGGASDLAAATTIAAAVYSSMQQMGSQSGRVVAVVDDTGDAVAFIGIHPVKPGLPEEG